MKKTIKNCLIAALSFACIGVAGVATVSASANETATTIASWEDVGFEMISGASIRVDQEDVSGIRFSAKMKVGAEAWLKANYDKVEFGTFIMPVEYGAFTVDSLFGANSAYYWEGKEKTNDSQKEILQMDSAVYTDVNKATNEEFERINGSIKVHNSNFNKEFIGVGYVALTNAEGTTYKLATENDNERTILYVAQKALEQEGWETTDTKYTNTLNFIESYKTNNPDDAMVNYTVNKHFRTTSGAFTTVPEVREAPLNSNVTLKAENEQEEFYALDTASSLMTGTAYAQGKLTLDLYYGFKLEANDVTVMFDINSSTAYAIDYNETSCKWSMLCGGMANGITITPTYLNNAVKKGVNKLVLYFGPNGDGSFGFDADIYPASVTESGRTLTVSLTQTEYTEGVTIRFWQNDGNTHYESIWFTIQEVGVQENAITAFRWVQNISVEYKGNNVWHLNKIQDNVAYVVTKDYIDFLMAQGAKGMSVKFENLDDPSAGVKINGNVYLSTSTGAAGAQNENTDCATFDRTNVVWTVDFTKVSNWNGNFGSGWTDAKAFSGVACHFYLYNGSLTKLSNVKITITPTY